VVKSIDGMTKAMQMDAKPAERDPGERIEQLKQVFLDFSKKLKQPEFIIPEEQGLRKAFFH
jgi:phage-related protein